MSTNPLRALWNQSRVAINAWLSIASPFSAEIIARQGYDSVTIDMQHGVIGYTDMVSMLQAMTGTGVAPIVRVPWNEPGIIMKSIDAGAWGVICPMINNREEAERLVATLRYPPLGNRSYGPTRALFTNGPNYYETANEQVICLAMIETAEGMKNLDEIVSTPGLDGVYIGPSDLSLGLSNGALLPGQDRREPEIVDAFQKILTAAHGAGIKACLHTASASYARQGAEWGFDLVTLSNDVGLLKSAASTQVAEARQLIAELG